MEINKAAPRKHGDMHRAYRMSSCSLTQSSTHRLDASLEGMQSAYKLFMHSLSDQWINSLTKLY